MADLVTVTLPEMGESVTEGTVVEWRKTEGDPVTEGEVVADVTTDKVDVEVPAPATGVLRRILAPVGATLPVGAPLAEIEVGATPVASGAAPAATAGASPGPSAPPGGGTVSGPPSGAGPDVAPSRPPGAPEPGSAPAPAASASASAPPSTSASAPAPPTSAPVPPAATAPVDGGGAGAARASGVGAAGGGRSGTGDGGSGVAGGRASPLATPLARRAAAIAGIDLTAIPGHGPGGMVRRSDVLAAVAAAATPPSGNGEAAADAGGGPATLAPAPASAAAVATAPSTPAPSRAAPAPVSPPPRGATPLRGPAAALATAMEQSREIPTATSFRTIEVDVLEARRRELNDALRAAGRPEKISFTHIVGFAVARATLTVPSMTAHFERQGDTLLRVQPGCHLGLAVDVTRRDGTRFLVVPVIRDAAERDFASFRNEYERLVAKARSNALTVEEMRGASITLTNPGGIGTVASVPRLMPGNGTIVATGAIDFPAGVRHIGEARLRDLGVSKVMTLTSTYDHRVIQGAESGEFLRRIEELLAGGDGFYEEIFRSLGLSPPAAQPAVPELSREAAAQVRAAAARGADHELLAAVSAGMSLVKAFRTHGHLGARLDPLGTEPIGDPSMEPSTVGLTPALMAAVPADVLRVYVPGETLADVLPRLRETYCSTIAYEIEHLSSHEQRVWLREQIESGRHRQQLSPERQIHLLHRLTKVEAMERYLRRTFIGQKTFSIEGLDAMVPMLEELLTMVADEGIGQVVMGMAHRGRLAVITHVCNRPYESILVTFELGEQRRQLGQEPTDPTGDVKYHLGATGTYLTTSGKAITVRLLSNPSHLEAVDPVVEGWTRAEQTRRNASTIHVDPTAAVPVLIHGDASFPGQGVVAEVLNLQSLAGYATGGTVHIIANNQIGFTTEPSEARSTRYASDLAKGFDIPIIHVNADDIEACIHAIRLAWMYRRTFHRDVVVDLVGYRRFGHNEADEPSYTQPLMYKRIKEHPTVREIYAKKLVEAGLITAEEAEQRAQAAYQRVADAHARVKASMAATTLEEPLEPVYGPGIDESAVRTTVPAATLVALNEQLLSFPDGFHVNPKLLRQIERRRQEVREGVVEWPAAEALAFASLLLQGRAVRLTGQDTERGTFSQRHLVFHDVETGAKWTPIQHLVGATATFELHNSPLSEEGALGFEYGYSAATPDTMVIWEAQYGDFVNAAQVIVDQFIVSGEAKWGQRSRLTLLLPHGYEGQGPEHSSARLERFLQLSANGNIRVANCSTAAQYFHLLRHQALTPRPRPLVIMTPKSLLRLREAAATLDELAHGRFRNVIDDPLTTTERREQVTTLLLCSGKIYWDLVRSPLRAKAERTAIARVEMLDPLPLDEILALIRSYPRLEQLFWVQEEPKNMGAWNHVARPIGRHRPYHIRWDYIGRPRRASPSEGFHGAHELEQERIVTEALTIENTPSEEALALARSGSQS